MKEGLIVALIFGGWFSMHAQSVFDNDSVYLIAIEKYIVELDSFHMKYSPEPYERKDVIFLEKSDWLKNVPSSISGVEIVLLDEDWKDVYRKNGRELVHLKVFPIEIVDDYIEVSLTLYHGRLKKGKLFLEVSDWTKIYFKYNCNDGSWKYDRTENGGI